MLRSSAQVASVLAVCAAATWALCWAHLPPTWRRGFAIALSAAGVAFLGLAMGAEGWRESETVARFLLGTQQVTGQASASASLPYYVATAACLLLGTAALAVPDDTARRMADRWFASAVAVSLVVTALRFLLEKVAAPRAWTYAVGITWLAPIVGAFFALNLRREGKGVRALLGRLLLYGFAARGAVAGLMILASSLRLGSHYDVTGFVAVRSPFSGRLIDFEPGSWSQILTLGVVPQLTFWPLYTLLAGLVGAGLALLAANLLVDRSPVRPARPSAEPGG